MVQSDMDDCYSEKFNAVATKHGVEMVYRWGDDLKLELPKHLRPDKSKKKDDDDGEGEEKGDGGSYDEDDKDDMIDLVFIDTLHVYGQLKRELTKFAPFTRRYLVLHDTTTDGEDGECLRLGTDTQALSRQTGIPEFELKVGLWPAVEEFLEAHQGEWALHERYKNNNGLTVLKRKTAALPSPPPDVAATRVQNS